MMSQQALLSQMFSSGGNERQALLDYAKTIPQQPEPQSLVQRIMAETALGKMVSEIGQAVTAPGDAYAGRLDPMSQEATERMFNLAGIVTGGAGAFPAASNELRAGVKLRSGAETPETDLAWLFKDVQNKPTLTPAENRRFSSGATTHDSVVVPVRSLNATQAYVNPDFATTSSSFGELPYVFRKGGQMYVSDGHHRITKAIHEGAENVRVRLLDLDGRDTSAPLLDWKPRKKSEMSDDDLLKALLGN